MEYSLLCMLIILYTKHRDANIIIYILVYTLIPIIGEESINSRKSYWSYKKSTSLSFQLEKSGE